MSTPASVAEVMERTCVWWAVAGGWAIDLWLGEQTRDHHDVEVIVRRSDQQMLHDALSERWDLYALDPPGSGWRPWNGTPIAAPAFQLQARAVSGEFDVFTEDAHDTVWYFRRDHRITAPATDVIVRTGSGIPVVRPDIQLLYMAKSAEPKNEQDFDVALPRLTADAAHWLRDALTITVPGHRWLARLGS
jgi:hypothetical protein